MSYNRSRIIFYIAIEINNQFIIDYILHKNTNIMIKKSFITTFFIGLFSLIGFSQTYDTAKLNQYFNTLEEHNKFMGSVAVSQNGKIIYTKSLGFSDVENQTLAHENTKYRIGSISKTFTAVLALKAVEQNLISLEHTIDQWFPDVPNAEKITVKDLLNHRSGIFNFTNDPFYLKWNTEPKTEEEMIAIVSRGSSDFEPGSQMAYSNSNYVLLTFIIERSFGKSYAELLKIYITEPLGLNNTYFGGKINPKKEESYSYSYVGDWKKEAETDTSIPLGAGGIVSNPIDLVQFSDALFAGKLLNEESMQLMTSLEDGFGLGLIQMPFHIYKGLGHTGGIDGATSIFSHFEDKNISYALTSNGTNYNNNDISIAVLSAIYDLPYAIPEFSNIQLKAEDLDQYLGVYASDGLPIELTISKKGNVLMGQATGQQSFPLEPTAAHVFEFALAGVVMEFEPKNETLVLKQGGGEFVFKKK